MKRCYLCVYICQFIREIHVCGRETQGKILAWLGKPMTHEQIKQFGLQMWDIGTTKLQGYWRNVIRPNEEIDFRLIELQIN